MEFFYLLLKREGVKKMKIKIKKLLLAPLCAVAVIAGIATFAAFEAHVINVTAHIENALAVSPESMGIEFGTVFPQEYFDDQTITIELSESFKTQERVNEVNYKIVQKPKLWRDDFDGTPPLHRSLGLIDPDNNGTKSVSDGKLSLTTGDDTEDLFGQNEVAGDWTAPRMVMVQGGDFTVETQIVETSLPSQYYRSAGILAYGQDGDLVRLEVSNWAKWGMGYVVYMESQIKKVKDAKRYASVSEYTDNIYLKMTRTGDNFKGYYSFDGSGWTEVNTNVPDGSGTNPMANTLAGKTAMVGVSAVDSKEESDGSNFTANFEYVEMNGNYGDFCKFLSKMPEEEEESDVGELSYYDESGAAPVCANREPDGGVRGILNNSNDDTSDTWTIDLKVPPVEGYVGQDWPESCREWTVPAEADYGCDLWIEVTGIN
jgi:regulation of enolase protein 1 (concanavalin A-like superfamily)